MAGLLSGRNVHNSTMPNPIPAAIVRKPATSPNCWTMKPVTVVLTAAEMPVEEKNRVSHRGRALAELAARMREAGW